MPQVFCPKCGSEIPEGTIICPNCQFDIRDYNREAEEELTSLLTAQKGPDDADAEPAQTSEAAAASSDAAQPEGAPCARSGKSAPKTEEAENRQTAEQPEETESGDGGEEPPPSVILPQKEKKPNEKKAKAPKTPKVKKAKEPKKPKEPGKRNRFLRLRLRCYARLWRRHSGSVQRFSFCGFVSHLAGNICGDRGERREQQAERK